MKKILKVNEKSCNHNIALITWIIALLIQLKVLLIVCLTTKMLYHNKVYASFQKQFLFSTCDTEKGFWKIMYFNNSKSLDIYSLDSAILRFIKNNIKEVLTYFFNLNIDEYIFSGLFKYVKN